jgi:predicted nucleic acid-binding protein
MSGNKKALLDTNVIIFASKGIINADALLNDYDEFYTSIISYMEVYGYDFKNLEDKQIVDEIFENIEIIDLNREIANQVIVYRASSTKKIKLPDAIY